MAHDFGNSGVEFYRILLPRGTVHVPVPSTGSLHVYSYLASTRSIGESFSIGFNRGGYVILECDRISIPSLWKVYS